MKIRLSDFGYAYVLGDREPVPEARYVRGLPEEKVLWGMCFGEPRTLGDVTVRLAEPMPDFDTHVGFQTFTPAVEWINSKDYTWHHGHFDAYPIYPEKLDDSTWVYRGRGILTSKVRFLMAMPWRAPESIPAMEVTIEGVSDYVSRIVYVRTGLWGLPGEGTDFEIFNGLLLSKQTMDENTFRLEMLVTENQRPDDDRTDPDRTVLTIRNAAGTVSVLTRHMTEQAYVQIPDFGVLAYADPDALPKGITDAVIRTGKKVREAVRDYPQRTFAQTEQDIGLKPVNMTEETLHFEHREPPVRLDIPEERMRKAWEIGLSHVMAFCNREDDGKWNVRIGPYPMFGSESSPIIKIIEAYGLADVPVGALEKFLDTAGKFTPEAEYASAEGCLCVPYGVYPGDCWQPHEPAYILTALAEHYLVTRDKAWLSGCADKIIACLRWVFREIQHHRTPGAWDEGLMPPVRHGDMAGRFSSYWGHGLYYRAMEKSLRALKDLGGAVAEEAAAMEPAFTRYRADLRRAYRKSVSLSPCVPLRDGTFAPAFPSCVYMQGWLWEVYPVGPDMGLRNAWLDVDFSLEIFAAGVFGPEERETRWALDAFEDCLCLNDYLMPKKWDEIGSDPRTRARDATQRLTDYDPARDWFAWGGTGWQNGYCPLAQIYLITGEVNAFLRTLYNTYAIEADPENYWFREHAGTKNYPPKTFEEAMFLLRLRGMFAFEHEDALYLCRAVPDAWFGCPMHFAGLPTDYGKLDFTSAYDPQAHRLTVSLLFPEGRCAHARAMYLRGVAPDGRKPQRVLLNGEPLPCGTDMCTVALPTDRDSYTVAFEF